MTEEIEINEHSALPPLNTASSPSLSPKNTKASRPNAQSQDSINPQHLRKEIYRLYPRIQALEKDISTIKQQLPSNLAKTILQISQDINRLRSKAPFLDSNNNDENIDLSAELADLENRLLSQLELTMKNSTDQLNQQITKAIKQRPKSQILASPIENDFPTVDIDSQVRRVESSISQQLNRNQVKINNLEQKLSEIIAKQSDNQFTNLNKEIEKNKQSIIDLRSQYQMLSIKIDSNKSAQPIVFQAPKEEPKETETISFGFDDDKPQRTTTKTATPPQQDLTLPITQIQQDIEQCREQYGQAILHLQQRSEEFETKIASLNTLIQDLTSSSSVLNTKLNEIEILCNSLNDQMNELQQKTLENDNQKMIQTLAMQIQSIQDNMKNEITSIRDRLKKCEMSVPLV